MKKVSLLLVLIIVLFTASTHAQGVPQGMKYQAVARNLAGGVIANQEISLKISLLTKGSHASLYYTEVHTVTTNQLGLFTVVVGAGKVENGAFKTIPWSTEDVWLQVAIKDKGKTDFAVISSSQLFAVPYAFHAGTASELVSNSKGAMGGNESATSTIQASSTTTTSGTNSSNGNSWNIGGNLGTDPAVHYLGSADNVDLVIKTNTQTRFIFLKNGNDTLYRTLSIGANLNVDTSVNLNRATGSTLNNGPFTVGTLARRSPTYLFGTLTVDTAQATRLGGTLDVNRATQLNSTLTVAGVTNLNNDLNVNRSSSTKLTGTLQVDGVTDLNSRLRVNNIAPTILTGTLNVQRDATFKEKVTMDTTLNADTLSATVTGPNGALTVMGGVWIDRNLVLQGDARFGGNTSFAGPVRITDGTQSTSSQTGALTVGGGAGIAKNLNVSGATKFDSTFNVLGNSTLGGTLTVANPTTLNNTLSANGQVTVNANVSATGDQNYDAYPLRVQGSDQGIAIKVNGATQTSKNYVSFFDGSGKVTGRIEGNTVDELDKNFEYSHTTAFLGTALALQTAEAAITVAESVEGGIKVVAASTSSTACVGLGACFTAPIPSLIVEAGSNLILKIANVAVGVANVAVTAAELATYVQDKKDNIGVSYESGAGDYAEWLLKEDRTEIFKPGEIVAIRNGKITKNTEGATQLLVISLKPIVLGNMPKEGAEKDYEKVAFMGQVPVYVLGNVEKGDYIVADGLGDGFGVAINPAKMKMEHYKKIVGVAWSSSTGKGISMVNVAVGLNRNDMADVLQQQEATIKSQQAEINELRAQGQQTNNILAKLLPGFKEAAGITTEAVVRTTPTASAAVASSTAVSAAAVMATSTHNDVPSNFVTPDPSTIVYHEITDDQVEQMFAMAEKVFVESGGKFDEHPFWKKIKSGNGYKAIIMNQVKDRMKNAVHYHEEANKKISKP